MSLFQPCTSITIGNGNHTRFWHDHWVQGQSLAEIASSLICFAWRKNQLLAHAIPGAKWMRGLHRISMAEEMNHFVQLWTLVHRTQLTDAEDEIAWRFTTTGSYKARSAYLTQFNGSFGDYDWNKLWATKVENKCKMFGWLILQNEVWTTDRVAKYSGQSNMIYQL
jgi:hypothetical protein